MPKIKIIPQDLVNKIAAGEVVERPASVVKELLDNAYDAGASNIIVDIEEGGTKKVHVVDNGTGISKEDVELAFKRHATSKISTEEDLLNIRYYGFRGEALSSIAAVSKVTLRSRQLSDNLGTEIKIEGGKVISISEVGAPAGTSVLVEDLFYNIPARKEFLKSLQVEYRAILEIIDAYAIANPTVGISLSHNDKNIYTLPKDQKLEDRIREILGADFYEKLVPIFFEHPHIEIYGYIAKPELASERKKRQYIFVNKRYITDKSITFAVKNAYGSLIAKNTYPPHIIFIDIPTNIVDVNVHPRKEEVKFSNGKLIFDSVKAAVKKALDRTDLTPRATPTQRYSGPLGLGGKLPSTPKSTFGAPLKPWGVKPTPPFGTKTAGPKQPPARLPISPAGPSKQFTGPLWPAAPLPGTETPQNPLTAPANTRRGVLQIHNLYLATESESGIIIYDQHAVHERIIYDELIKIHKNQKRQGYTQGLLTPVIVNLSAQEAHVLSEYLDELEKAGFGIEDFGKNSYKITQIPAVLADKDLKGIFHELIEDLGHGEKLKDIDSKTDKMLTYLACRTAYKAGDFISEQEATAMIERLDKTDTKYTCPHGRPVKIELTLKELSKMFKRTK